MILIVDVDQADAVLAELEAAGEHAFIVGSVIAGAGEVVYE